MIVCVVMAASGNQTVGAVKSELTQRRGLHIAVGVVADVLAIVRCKPVIGIVGERGIAALQKVARRVGNKGTDEPSPCPNHSTQKGILKMCSLA